MQEGKGEEEEGPRPYLESERKLSLQLIFSANTQLWIANPLMPILRLMYDLSFLVIVILEGVKTLAGMNAIAQAAALGYPCDE